MARTLNGKLTGRAAHGADDIEAITDYSLKSRQYYLDEIAIEEEYICNHPNNPQRWEAQAVIDECRRCLTLIGEREEEIEAEEWKALRILADFIPPEPPVDWPWTHEDWLSELDNRRPEVCL